LSCAASVTPYHPMSSDFLDEILDAELVTLCGTESTEAFVGCRL
jgi:hypothetical protein